MTCCKSNTGPRAPSQHKDRPIQVRWFPCHRQDSHWDVLSLTWESPHLARPSPSLRRPPGPLIVIHLNGAMIAHVRKTCEIYKFNLDGGWFPCPTWRIWFSYPLAIVQQFGGGIFEFGQDNFAKFCQGGIPSCKNWIYGHFWITFEQMFGNEGFSFFGEIWAFKYIVQFISHLILRTKCAKDIVTSVRCLISILGNG